MPNTPHVRPTIDPPAALAIRLVSLDAPEFEAHFACEWSPERQAITSARLVARGNRGRVPSVVGAFSRGLIACHTHPLHDHEPLIPSDDDIAFADHVHPSGVGVAICDPAASRLYVLTEPRPAESAAAVAFRQQTRRWRLGRLEFTAWPRSR